MQTFKFIPIQGSTSERLAIHRVNCLGSLFYFVHTGLRRRRLTLALHYPVCLTLEKEHIKDVIEMPRDHFKSTIASEGLPMWWALPFASRDEDLLRSHGYQDEFIRWMKWAHDPES